MNRVATLRSVQELPHSPRLVLVARNRIRVLEWCTPEKVLRTFSVVFICILRWVVVDQPVSDHPAHNLRVLGNCIPISVMK